MGSPFSRLPSGLEWGLFVTLSKTIAPPRATIARAVFALQPVDITKPLITNSQNNEKAMTSNAFQAMGNAEIEGTETRRISRIIDHVLSNWETTDPNVILDSKAMSNPEELAERVLQRGNSLSRKDRPRSEAILEARDNLILAIYAHTSPRGWATGWCDGSSLHTKEGIVAGVGVQLVDDKNKLLVQFGRTVQGHGPLAAEISALATVMEAALKHRVEDLRVYTDCKALVLLWLQHRADTRLDSVGVLAGKLRRFEIRLLPRRHNGPMHRLARQAVFG